MPLPRSTGKLRERSKISLTTREFGRGFLPDREFSLGPRRDTPYARMAKKCTNDEMFSIRSTASVVGAEFEKRFKRPP